MKVEDLAVLVSSDAPETSHDGLESNGVALVERFVEKQWQDLALLHLLGERDSRRQQQLGPGTVRELIEFPRLLRFATRRQGGGGDPSSSASRSS